MTDRLLLLNELVRFARERSPFYRELYGGLPDSITSIEQLPLAPPAAFWAANTVRGSRLLTGPIEDGIFLRSGGTTGNPKFSVFTRAEWSRLTSAFAWKLPETGLRAGDRVANLFYVGELYGSFLFTHTVLEECPTPLVQLPIAGNASSTSTLRLCREFSATVLAGLPTTLLALAEELGERTEPGVRLLLFAGEPIREEQQRRLRKAFPGALVRSIGYASNDGGQLGYCDESCGPCEFRRYDDEAIYEIVDEATGQPIEEPGREGLAVVTALHRRLMPIIRYPVGDRAIWVEEGGHPDRKYRLLGRADDTARIASLSIGYDEVDSLLQPFAEKLPGYRFQLVVYHREAKDGLLIRLGASSESGDWQIEREVLEAFHRAQPIFRKFTEDAKIHPVTIEWVQSAGLAVNPRTGKLRRIIDQRAET